MAILSRLPKTPPEDPTFELYRKVRQITGYTGGYEAGLVADTPHRALLKVLQELDVMPFSNRSVTRYKNLMILKQHIKCIVAITVPTALALTVLIYGCVAGSTLIALSFIVPIVVAIVAGVSSYGRRTSFEWRTVMLCNYMSPVPDFALQTVVDVTEKLAAEKGARPTWHIDYLDRVVSPHPDPFLVVGYDGFLYYLEVWNEPKFKQKRTV